ncbi:TetR/AcrR family transcriptional regulator [Rathayibacter soli]|uniref:TetR/AcrR family transcriptional regulator n=1 Tax=Rathayibacter soli TaxID=3144168 RepID=UPI0027E55836|nr:helix-turn-helix domain-containing protein [Glaciibacter superstes]
MSRWEPDARGRLLTAAVELFTEQGFEQTTVTEIAERAGLTERTFFRHFADKREVLFFGQDDFLQLFVSAVAGAPADATPLEAVAAALNAAAMHFEPRRPWSQQRGGVIAANPGLQERELIKLAHLSSAVAEALRDRGVAEPTASLAAQAGVAVFQVGFTQWIDADNTRKLSQLMTDGLGALKVVVAAG